MRAKKSDRWVIGGAVGAVTLIGIVVILGSIIPADHAAVGKWRGGTIWSLIVYEGGGATLNSIQCSWEPADELTIKIRPEAAISVPEAPVQVNVGILLDFRLDRSGNLGELELMGFPVKMERAEGRSEPGENKESLSRVL